MVTGRLVEVEDVMMMTRHVGELELFRGFMRREGEERRNDGGNSWAFMHQKSDSRWDVFLPSIKPWREDDQRKWKTRRVSISV